MGEETKTAKVPEGVTVETPKQEELKKLPIPDFSLDPTLPMIQNPHYTNNNRTELACVLIRPDGMATTEKGIPADPNHPLYRDIRRQFSEDEIRHNTARQVRIQKSLQKAGEDAQAQQARERCGRHKHKQTTNLQPPQVFGTTLAPPRFIHSVTKLSQEWKHC